MNEEQQREHTPEEEEKIRDGKQKIWITLIVMLSSLCVGLSVIMTLFWFLFKKFFPGA